MSRSKNERKSGRFPVDIECHGTATRQKGRALLADVSHDGALVLKTGIVPIRGELIGVTADTVAGPLLLIGWCVRHVDDGFAIEFDHLDERAAAFIDDLSSVVPTRSRGRMTEKRRR
ncbi:MAG: PilZ domain-containing protein [Myxococcales bacterium]|nr:PilZ domain-containing protein [Myxococcales bacterium]